MSRKHPTDQPPEPKSDAQADVTPVQDPPADLGVDQPPEAPVVDRDAPPVDPDAPVADPDAPPADPEATSAEPGQPPAAAPPEPEPDPSLTFPPPCFAWTEVDGAKAPILNGEIVVDQAEREGITVLVTTGGRKIFLCTISEYEAVYGKLIPDVRVQIAARYPNAA